MTNIIKIADSLEKYVRNGKFWLFESHWIEYKKEILSQYEMSRYITGFLNADGGIILLGVTDSGEICGIRNQEKILASRENQMSWWDNFNRQMDIVITTRIIPPVTERIIQKYVIFNRVLMVKIIVPKASDSRIYTDIRGICWKRLEASTVQYNLRNTKSTAELQKRITTLETKINELELKNDILQRINKEQIRRQVLARVNEKWTEEASLVIERLLRIIGKKDEETIKGIIKQII